MKYSCSLFLPSFPSIFYFCFTWKSTKRSLPSTGSFSKWPQRLELRRSKARIFFLVPTWVQGPIACPYINFLKTHHVYSWNIYVHTIKHLHYQHLLSYYYICSCQQIMFLFVSVVGRQRELNLQLATIARVGIRLKTLQFTSSIAVVGAQFFESSLLISRSVWQAAEVEHKYGMQASQKLKCLSKCLLLFSVCIHLFRFFKLFICFWKIELQRRKQSQLGRSGLLPK